MARGRLAQDVALVAVGGNSTWNLDPERAPAGWLGPADETDAVAHRCNSTATELCSTRSLADAGSAFDAAASPRTQAIDLMRVRCTGLDGRPVDRFGYLIVALGLAATISHRTSQSHWLKKLARSPIS